MKRLSFVVLAACFALWPVNSSAAAGAVKVEGGLVQGVAEGDLAVYKGIPFAAPPIGDLRWKAPQPVVAWSGVRNADKYAPACAQSMGGPPPSGMSEDCLYLNVWTPEKLLEARRGQRGMAWPIVDGYVIPGDQYRLYESGRFNDTPILVGYNSDEGLSFTRVKQADQYAGGVRERYGPFADRLLAAYPAAGDAVTKTARDLARDSAFGWHTWSWARLQSARGKGKACGLAEGTGPVLRLEANGEGAR
jgi:carboxylesterase type B